MHILSINKKLAFWGALLVAVNILFVLGVSVTGIPLFIMGTTLLVTVFALVHGSLRYGWQHMAIFLLLVLGISWGYESLSIMTGFPFGNYNYTENFIGPWLGLVPVMIMPAYFAMGYMAWTIASILLDKRDAVIRGAEVILLPLLASFVMVMWDMSMDPFNSTIVNFWNWHDGGAYFGVPFGNFLGWFLTVFTFYFLFALIMRFKPGTRTNYTVLSRLFWVLPVLMYLARTIEYYFNFLTHESAEVIANNGHVYWTGDITGSLLLVSIFTMSFVGLYALIRIYRSSEFSQ